MSTPHNHSFRIVAPFTALWRWLMAKPGQPSQAPGSRATAPVDLSMRTQQPPNAPGNAAGISMRSAPRKPLRVLRVMDADLAPAQTGRLRISGRMADVCAELDRLAAHEAMLH